MIESQVINALAALSQETRMRMLRYLVSAGTEGAAAGQIGDAVGASSSRASFHLSALTQAGLITANRQSRQIIYKADFDQLGALVGYLLHDCCGGNARVLACCAPDAACCGPDDAKPV